MGNWLEDDILNGVGIRFTRFWHFILKGTHREDPIFGETENYIVDTAAVCFAQGYS